MTNLKIKIIYFAAILILLFSCTNNKRSDKNLEKELDQEIVIPEFQSIIDSAQIKGSILIYDFEDDKYYSNNYE